MQGFSPLHVDIASFGHDEQLSRRPRLPYHCTKHGTWRADVHDARGASEGGMRPAGGQWTNLSCARVQVLTVRICDSAHDGPPGRGLREAAARAHAHRRHHDRLAARPGTACPRIPVFCIAGCMSIMYTLHWLLHCFSAPYACGLFELSHLCAWISACDLCHDAQM